MPRIYWLERAFRCFVVCVLTANLALPVRSSSQLSEEDVNPLAGCAMCHVDVEEEYVGSPHFEQQIGCQVCHGPSNGHIADENNDVKPDAVFSRENLEDLCLTCHQFFTDRDSSSTGDDAKVCTDCHGYHDQKLLSSGDD